METHPKRFNILQGGGLYTPTIAKSGEKMTSGQIGRNVIGWGEGQTAEAVEQTMTITRNLTKSEVQEMARKGLTKSWVQDQLLKYSSASGNINKITNNQLQPRKELMEKILSLWD